VRRRSFIALFVLAHSLGASSALAANLADFTDYSLLGSRGQVLLPGRLFIPSEATASGSPRPLMLYLHGGGARGSDNTAQILQTPDYMLEEAKARGAFLYVPQTSDTWASTTMVDYVMSMIDRAIIERNADTNRLYATGYSNGGGGTWSLLSRNHGRFAAAMAMSGIIPAPGFNPSNLLGTAILALHARDDATVPVLRTRTVVDGILLAAGQFTPKYSDAEITNSILLVSNPIFPFHSDVAASMPPDTVNFEITRPDLDLMYLETPDGGHTGLLGAFYSPDVYSWMFGHTLAVPEPASAALLLCCLPMGLLCRRRICIRR
jgi:predicted esterase